MNREQKAAVIDEIAANIQESTAIFAVDYRGITVAQVADLRTKLRDADASFKVVKNTLTERAADQVGNDQLKGLLSGPTALTFVRGDAALAAKTLSDHARVTQLLAFKGGVMEGNTLSAEDVTSISKLPSRDVLYGQLVGLVASPISGLVRTLNALVGGLAIQLGGILEKKQSGEIPAGAPPAAAAAPVVEEPAAAEEATGAEDTAAVEEPAAVQEPAVAQEPQPESETESQPQGATENDNQADAPAEPAAEEEA
jgi:large subunit ribosomal protein L10